MFKLLFSSAMIAPVLLFAFANGSDDGDLFGADAQGQATAVANTAVLTASTGLPDGFATCESSTVAVVFHDDLLETHSAERVADAFAARPGCEVGFIRLTTLVPESPDAFDRADAERRRTELATTIEAVVGADVARTLPVHSDTQTTATERPIRHHALVRVERRPVAPVSVASASAAPATAGSTLN